MWFHWIFTVLPRNVSVRLLLLLFMLNEIRIFLQCCTHCSQSLSAVPFVSSLNELFLISVLLFPFKSVYKGRLELLSCCTTLHEGNVRTETVLYFSHVSQTPNTHTPPHIPISIYPEVGRNVSQYTDQQIHRTQYNIDE